jgi:ABC-type transporter Mla MlaB component
MPRTGDAVTDAAAPPVSFSVEGPATLRTIDEIRGRLLDMMQRHPALAIDCGGTTEADLSLVQLLLAARRSARQAGRSITLAKPGGAVLGALLARGGFLGAPDAAATDEDVTWLKDAIAP